MPLMRVLKIRFPDTDRYRIEYKSDTPAITTWIGLDSFRHRTEADTAFAEYCKDELFKDYIIRLVDLESDV